MWKFIGGLFSNTKVIDGLVTGLDKAWFSSEEKADIHLKFLDAYEPYRLAQRFLALMIVGVWLISYIAIGVLMGFEVGVHEQLAEYVHSNMSYPVLMVVGFYFGGSLISSFTKKQVKGDKK